MGERVSEPQITELGVSEINISWVPGREELVPVHSYGVEHESMGSEHGYSCVAYVFDSPNATEAYLIAEPDEKFAPVSYAEHVRRYGADKSRLELFEKAISGYQIRPPIERPAMYFGIVSMLLGRYDKIEDMYRALNHQQSTPPNDKMTPKSPLHLIR
ncbi:MAG TPA: hypothetical protein VLG16_05655 [Candidatus Saccharimonadales bacterium]|nr:hypothetical protein [Candidatus Saccharimonadales bacterium]